MAGAESWDVHSLNPEALRAEVHSFQHWFEAVSGFLAGTRHGHRVGIPDAPLPPPERERLVSTLCTYCVGETAALEASGSLVRIAPSQRAKIFLATQAVDEARHVEVLLARLGELGIADPLGAVEARAAPAICEFRQQLLRLVDAGEWEIAIFAQNVVLESMEYGVFQAHAALADPVTRDLLERILRDERRHLGFGENELGRNLRADPGLRARIAEVRRGLDQLACATFEHAVLELGIPGARLDEIARGYREAEARLGL
jgi:ferritin-like protein